MLVLGLVLLSCASAGSPPQWPMFRRTPNNTGYSLVAGPAGPVALKWSLDTGADIHSSPAIDGEGNLYLGVSSSVQAISAAGNLIWKFSTPRYQVNAPGLLVRSRCRHCPRARSSLPHLQSHRIPPLFSSDRSLGTCTPYAPQTATCRGRSTRN